MLPFQFSGLCLRFCAAISLVITCVIPTKIFAQNIPPFLSLNQAIENTLAQNPQLHQFKIKKTDLLAHRETHNLKPALNIDIEVENIAGSGDLSGIRSAETTLSLSSVIEMGDKRRARVSVANAKLQAFNYHQQAFTLDVLGELTRLFVQTLEVQEQIALAKEAYELAQNTLSIVNNRSQQGATSESEVKRAKAALSQARLHVDALQQKHERLRVKLAAYWGETSPKWKQLGGTLYTFDNTSTYSSLYERAQSSPAITLFASEARLKKSEVALAKTQSISDLSWQLGVRRFESSGDTAFTVGVSIPLFSGKRNRSSVRSAMASQNEVKYGRQTALLKLHVQLFEAYSQRQQHVAAVKAFRDTIIPDLNAALTATQQAYETGRYSYQDWISAQKEVLNAKRSLIENAAAASLNQAVIEQLIAEPLHSSASINK